MAAVDCASMKTTDHLKAFCDGRKHAAVAERLRISRVFFSYLYNDADLDDLMARIRALPLEKEQKKAAAGARA